MEVDFFKILSFAIKGILGFSIILMAIVWKRVPKVFHILGLYLIWNLLIEMVVISLPKGTNNLPLLHLYTLVEFILFTLMYKKAGLFNRWKTGLFWTLLIGISLLVILNSAFLQSIYSYNSYAKTLIQLFLIGYAIAYFFELREESSNSAPFNLVNIAILLSYSGSLFVFMSGNVLLGNKYNSLFWDINILLNFVFQILLFLSIWKASRVRKLQF